MARRSGEDGTYWSGLSMDDIYRLAQRHGCDGLGTGGSRGYFKWLAQARPLPSAELLAMLLPQADTWEELEKLCIEDGLGEGVGFALRDCYHESIKRVEAMQSLQTKTKRRR